MFRKPSVRNPAAKAWVRGCAELLIQQAQAAGVDKRDARLAFSLGRVGKGGLPAKQNGLLTLQLMQDVLLHGKGIRPGPINGSELDGWYFYGALGTLDGVLQIRSGEPEERGSLLSPLVANLWVPNVETWCRHKSLSSLRGPAVREALQIYDVLTRVDNLDHDAALEAAARL